MPWWMIFVLTCFLNWLAVLTAGIIVKKKAWVISGIAYSVPFILLLFMNPAEQELVEKTSERFATGQAPLTASDSAKYSDALAYFDKLQILNDTLKKIKERNNNYKKRRPIEKEIKITKKDFSEAVRKVHPEVKNSPFVMFVMVLWLLSSIAALIHAVIIRKPYTVLYENMQTEKAVQNRQGKHENKPESLNEKAERFKKEIRSEVKKNKNLPADYSRSILDLTDKYNKHIETLITDEEILAVRLAGFDVDLIRKEHEKYKRKAASTNNPKLKTEYEILADAKKKLLNSQNEMLEKHQLVKAKIDSALTNLQQMKYDLHKLAGISSEKEKRNRFFRNFSQTANELSVYARELDETLKKYRDI